VLVVLLFIRYSGILVTAYHDAGRRTQSTASAGYSPIVVLLVADENISSSHRRHCSEKERDREEIHSFFVFLGFPSSKSDGINRFCLLLNNVNRSIGVGVKNKIEIQFQVSKKIP
jgi:hypothetical protein